MKTAKQQAIEAAYGEHWDKVKDFIDEYFGSVPTFPYLMEEGHDKDTFFWKVLGYDYENIEEVYGDCEPSRWRPKSLQGIEINNGWIRIESEDDLPKENGNFKIITDSGFLNESYPFLKDMPYNYQQWVNGCITHYKPITTELKPLY